MAEPNAPLQDLVSLGDRYSVVFPAEFAAHIRGQFPGIYVEVKEAVWPRPKLFDVGPFWSFLYGLHTFTAAASSEDWMRLDYVAEEFQKSTGHKCAPILRLVGDADMYCVDASGCIVRYDHETNLLSPQTIDFWALFEREVEELKKRKNQKIAQA